MANRDYGKHSPGVTRMADGGSVGFFERLRAGNIDEKGSEAFNRWNPEAKKDSAEAETRGTNTSTKSSVPSEARLTPATQPSVSSPTDTQKESAGRKAAESEKEPGWESSSKPTEAKTFKPSGSYASTGAALAGGFEKGASMGKAANAAKAKPVEKPADITIDRNERMTGYTASYADGGQIGGASGRNYGKK